MHARPTLLLTLGDVAGVGPEIVARAWPQLFAHCRPVVVGDPGWLRRGLGPSLAPRPSIRPSRHPAEAQPSPDVMPCLAGSDQDLSGWKWARLHRRGGPGRLRLPLHGHRRDAGRRGRRHRDGAAAQGGAARGRAAVPRPHGNSGRAHRRPRVRHGAGGGRAWPWSHVTLAHGPARRVPPSDARRPGLEKARLLDGLLRRLLGRQPRLGVAALNPHASDGGLFGDEEATLIAPAVVAGAARRDGRHRAVADRHAVRPGPRRRVRRRRRHVPRSGPHRPETAGPRPGGEHQRRPADRAHQRGPRHGLRHRGPEPCRPSFAARSRPRGRPARRRQEFGQGGPNRAPPSL